MMDYVLDEDFATNDIQYFFTIHGPRFEYMNQAMAASLSARFGKKFRSIRILNAWPSNRYSTGNYVVMNKRGYKLSKDLGKPVVYLPDYEDVNVEFRCNQTIQEIAAKLLKKQQTVFVYPFTTSFLDLPADVFTVLGPDSRLAKTYDNKVNQLKLFEKLNLPHNRANIFTDEAALLKNQVDLVPCYLSASYTSGGNESGIIYDQTMLHEFLAKLRDINKENSFIVSDIFEDIVLAPNINAIVTEQGKVYILVIADQILQGNRYLGNLYPSVAKPKHIKQIRDITETLGNYLASKGYKGLFGCDFLINRKGDLIVVDLNPRHQGGYAINGLALQKKNLSLTDLELATYQSEEVVLSQAELNKQLDFAWSHSKLVPAEKGQVVLNEYCLNDIEAPFKRVGESFAAEFYRTGSVFIEGYIGYQVQTAQRRDQLETKMLQVEDKYKTSVFGL